MDYKDIKFPNMVDNKIDKEYIYGPIGWASGLCCVALSSYMQDSTKININLDLDYIDPITEFCKDMHAYSDFDLRSYPSDYEYQLCSTTDLPVYGQDDDIPSSSTVKYELAVSGLYRKFGIHITGLTSANGTAVTSLGYTPTVYLRIPELNIIETKCDSNGNLLSGLKIFNDTGIPMNLSLIIGYGPSVISKSIIGDNLTIKDLIIESDMCNYDNICYYLDYDVNDVKLLMYT